MIEKSNNNFKLIKKKKKKKQQLQNCEPEIYNLG